MLADVDCQPYPLPAYSEETEKWVDLDGTKSIYLRMVYGADP